MVNLFLVKFIIFSLGLYYELITSRLVHFMLETLLPLIHGLSGVTVYMLSSCIWSWLRRFEGWSTDTVNIGAFGSWKAFLCILYKE